MGALFLVPSTHAQTTSERYTFVFVHVPLADALTQLIQETNINLVFPSALTQGRTSSCRVEQASLEDVLRCILHDTGLDFVRLSSGTYVVREAPHAPPASVRLSGQVLDVATGEPLAYAHIVLDEAERGAITNEAGRFVFTNLLPGGYQISASYLGYRTLSDSISIVESAPAPLTLALEAEPLLAAPIVVNGLTRRLPLQASERTQRSALEVVPASATADALANLSTIIGIHAGDALADVHVQGGEAGEHQFRLDGATVFAPIRVAGLIGPFSPFALRRITVQKAGFGAEHGSHLSGIIHAEHTLQGLGKENIVIQADPLSLNARATGRFGGIRLPETRWMLAGRRGGWDHESGSLAAHLHRWSAPDPFLFDAPAFLLPSIDDVVTPEPTADEDTPLSFDPVFADEEAQEVDLVFSDLHAALHMRFAPTRSLHASFYQGRSKLQGLLDERLIPSSVNEETSDVAAEEEPFDETFISNDRYTWRNTVGQARYEWVVGSTAFASVSGWISQYNLSHPFDFFFNDLELFEDDEEYEHEDEEDEENEGLELETYEDRNHLEEVGLKTQWHYAANRFHVLTAGLEGIYTNSSFSTTMPWFAEGPDGQHIEFGIRAWRWDAFINDRIDLSSRTTLNLGTRLTYLPSHQTVYAEPRVSLRHDHSDAQGRQWITQVAAGFYRQYLQQLDVATYQINALSPSYRFWLPLEGTLRPPQAYHLSLSFLAVPNERWQFQAESYYKHQPHLLVVDYPTLLQRPAIEVTDLDEFLRSASGVAYGAGLTARYHTSKLRVEGHYAYSHVQRRTPNRFEGRSVSVPWNAPHRFNAQLEYQLSPEWIVSVRGSHVYGRAWGFRQAYYDFLATQPQLQEIGAVDLTHPDKDRLPAYIQWDAGIAFTTTIRRATIQARLYALNLTNRENIGDRSLEVDTLEEDEFILEPVGRPLTPFFPSFTLRLSW